MESIATKPLPQSLHQSLQGAKRFGLLVYWGLTPQGAERVWTRILLEMRLYETATKSMIKEDRKVSHITISDQ